MTREERELTITYLEEMKESYIEGVGYERHPLPEYYAIESAIKALEQEPRWIPVSERLPEDSGDYLVSVIDDEDEDYKQVGVAYFAHPNDYDIDKGEWRELMIDEKVIAWMPLPTPYEPQESEEEYAESNN